MFKILASQRIKATEDLGNSYIPEIIPYITEVMGKPQGSGHNLKWTKAIGEVDLVVELKESAGARFGVELTLRIPDILYTKSIPLNKIGWSPKRFVEGIMDFYFALQKLPRYKKLDEGTRQQILQFKQKYAP